MSVSSDEALPTFDIETNHKDEVLDEPTLPAKHDNSHTVHQTAIPISAFPTSSQTENATLKKRLLGPSVGKPGQDNVDQRKVAEVIYEASKGSKYFSNESRKDAEQTRRIEKVLKKKAELDKLDLSTYERKADEMIAKLELERDLSQTIIHVDCDAFYASVEELDHPELKTVPMAVGKGVLTTCNYEARKFGCRSGMAGHIAMKLCPQLICVPLDFAKYGAKAKEIREVLARYDPRYEAASVDEAYLNITKYLEDHDMNSEEAVQQLRQEVFEHSKVTISAGIAPNSRIAKIASDKNKPNGQFRIPNERTAVMAFMRDLPIRKVKGIGRVTERCLEAVGIKKMGDVYKMRGYIEQLFGDKSYEFLLHCYLGLGRTDISPAGEHIRKSIGTESTFRDISGHAQLREKLRQTAESLEEDLLRHELAGRVLHIKVKQNTYMEAIRQKHVGRAIWKAQDLYDYALPMLLKLDQELKPMKLRLMGLRLTNLISTKKDEQATKDFFKVGVNQQQLEKKQQITYGGKPDHQGEVWETWPDEEWTKYENTSSGVDDFISELPLGDDIPDFLKQETSVDSAVTENSWSCPICMRDQPADDKLFNDHVDYCLSKQTIKEVINENSNAVLDGGEHGLIDSRSESPQKRDVPTSKTLDILTMMGKRASPAPLTRGRKRRKP